MPSPITSPSRLVDLDSGPILVVAREVVPEGVDPRRRTSWPALFLALVLLSAGYARLAAAVFLLVAAGFLANAGLGTYHAGAEWKFWPGPDTCGGAPQPLSTGGGLLKDLATTRVIRCDEAPWHFLGLSFAGWNVVASVLLAIGSVSAAAKAWRS